MFSRGLILTAALLLDRFIGDPPQFWSRAPHPVALFGGMIGWADKRLNTADKTAFEKRRDGFITTAALLLLAGAAGMFLHCLFMAAGLAGFALEAAFASIFLAQKSLADHVSAVASALRTGGLAAGRRAVSMIVGRDPEQLDESGVCRACIESLAENASDGVVAPAFWYLIGGLPGLLAYKMLNTADSMIGHMSGRHRDFGRFAAKLDDAANWIPARLTGLLVSLAVAVGEGTGRGWRVFSGMARDARLHRSPNAGWPEAAMACATGLELGGPRQYGGAKINEAPLNGAGRQRAELTDIGAALRLFWKCMTLLTLLVVCTAIL